MKGKLTPIIVFDGQILTRRQFNKIKRKFLKENPKYFQHYNLIFNKFFKKENIKGEKI